jgi:hypothetical protein
MSTKRIAKKAGTAAATKKTPKSSPAKKTSARRTAKKAEPVKVAPKKTRKQVDRDPRLPAIGQTLEREFKGKTVKVKVTADGFEHDGQTFKSISACARHITGYMISGPVFFRLVEPKRAAAKEA